MNRVKRVVFVALLVIQLLTGPASVAMADRGGYVSFTGGFTGVNQTSMGNSYDPLSVTDRNVSSFSFDLNLHSRLPTGGSLLAHLESGDGTGINPLMNSYQGAVTSGGVTFPATEVSHSIAPNYDVFRSRYQDVDGTQSQAVNLSQVYIEQPLFSDRLLLNFGKMDAHALYDQNEFAGDETSQFLAGPLVRMTGTVFHEADGYYVPTVRLLAGITPWLRLNMVAMFNYQETGRDSIYAIETHFRTDLAGAKGNYRLYVIIDNRPYADLAGNQATDLGYGVSFDQYITAETGVFFRYALHAAARSQNLVTSGAVFGLHMDNMFGRRGDTFGLGFVKVRNSADHYQVSAYSGPLLVEAYYRLNLGKGFSITPDFQYHGGMNREVSNTVMLFGLRLQADF